MSGRDVLAPVREIVRRHRPRYQVPRVGFGPGVLPGVWPMMRAAELECCDEGRPFTELFSLPGERRTFNMPEAQANG